MSAETVVLIAENDASRIDAYLAGATEYSRSQLQKWLKSNAVLLNGKSVKPNAIIRQGDTILLRVPEAEVPEAVPQNIPLEIVYEDDALCVIQKPKGMVVHPAPGNPDGTLVNALLYHFGTLHFDLALFIGSIATRRACLLWQRTILRMNGLLRSLPIIRHIAAMSAWFTEISKRMREPLTHRSVGIKRIGSAWPS